MARELFTGSEDPEWRGEFFERLAEVCMAAGLTVREARALNCCSRNLTLEQAGRMVGMEGSSVHVKKAMWANLHRAEGKLAAWISLQERPATTRRASRSSYRFLHAVLHCMRTFQSKPRPRTYDERGTLVTIRGRLVTPHDLKRPEGPAGDWLEDLCLLVRVKLEQDQQCDDR